MHINVIFFLKFIKTQDTVSYAKTAQSTKPYMTVKQRREYFVQCILDSTLFD